MVLEKKGGDDLDQSRDKVRIITYGKGGGGRTSYIH